MKKVLILSLLFFTGCSSTSYKTMTCSRTTNKMGVSMDLSYTIKYSDDIVSEIESIEKLRSNDINKLNDLKNEFENLYRDYNGADYYTYNVSLENNTLTNTYSIVYNRDDTNTLLKVAQSGKSFSKIGRVNLDSLLSYYKSVGVTCEKK